MKTEDLNLQNHFTTDGTDICRIETYFRGPSCVMVNMATGKRQEFGMNSLSAKKYKKIRPK